MSRNKIQIVVGGQYGSEAKGAIAAYLVEKEQIDIAVRTGATNAGHTVVVGGVKVAMQQLPVGFVRPETKLVLGAGALIDPAILEREILLLESLGYSVRDRIFVDRRAYIHRPDAAERSKASGRHHLIGATGKGCSEALIDRVRLRGVEDWTVDACQDHLPVFDQLCVCDTEQLLNNEWNQGAKIQLEGTQGIGLDLYLGPYPYTTHKQTTVAQWMSECGLSPALPTDIVMVVRTFPIRVAGNSGPLPEETSWPILARAINMRVRSHRQAGIVSDAAIAHFEDAVRAAARGEFYGRIPHYSDGLDQHHWTSIERLRFKDALSELNKTALNSLLPEVQEDLKALFEFTTVTKKLRRVARISPADLRRFGRQVRPHRVAVTFMNYVFPELWGSQVPVTPDEQWWLQENVEEPIGARVVLINRGPASEHIIEA